MCCAGVTTDEIDRVVHEATIARGAYPSPLNYYNFPKSVCTSVNEVGFLSTYCLVLLLSLNKLFTIASCSLLKFSAS